VARYDDLKPDIVDGKISSERVVGEITDKADANAELLTQALKKEGAKARTQDVFDDMVKKVTAELDDSADLDSAL
jgi:rRNA maturation endonuclease Nob1